MSARQVFLCCQTLLLSAVILIFVRTGTAQDILPIGQIQGRAAASEYQDRFVRFRGIITGLLEDENARGTRFYTVFVQDVPGGEDGDPETSDGIALFVGARRPSMAIGDIAQISGVVTEFYGLTELDNNGLEILIESRNNPLPRPVALDPPADNHESAQYFERYEAMRVEVPVANVVGPAHVGCGFSVVREGSEPGRILVRNPDDPAGQIVGVLHPSDVVCDTMPDVGYGDEVQGLVGPLIYHFDRFKIVYQDPAGLTVHESVHELPAALPEVPAGGFVVATFNVEDYFDIHDDTGDEAEPKPSKVDVTLKQAKLAVTIGDLLRCPTLLGLQEVENIDLLTQLVAKLAERCYFEYQISHLDSPDARGLDLALLSDPGLVDVGDISLRQSCSELDTGIIDPNTSCQVGHQPLFSRPPLQVEVTVGGRQLTILVNHFKSKRGGVEETAPRRLAQADHLRALAEETHTERPGSQVIVLGDFNDYDGAELMERLLDQGLLADGLQGISADQRYSYIFDGASQLIDWILLTEPLMAYVTDAGILHTNADFPFRMSQRGDSASLPYRSSDHDIPYVIIDLTPEAASLQPTAASQVGQTPSPEPPGREMPAATPEPAATQIGVLIPEPPVQNEPDNDVTPESTLEKGVESDGDSSAEDEASARRSLPWIVLLGLGVLVAAAITWRVRR